MWRPRAASGLIVSASFFILLTGAAQSEPATPARVRPPGRPALPLKIDMGMSGRSTHKAVNCGSDTHNPGFAWAYGMVRDGNRYSEPDTWFCDFVEGQDATFLVAVEPPESTFTVTLTLGDPALRRGPVTVLLNDRVIADSITTEAGQRHEVSGRTATRNGWIEVRLRTDDCSGFAVNGMEISGPDPSWIGELFPPKYLNQPLPEPGQLPRVGSPDLRVLLRNISEYLIHAAPVQGGFSYHGAWYQNAYPIRTLLAASRILNEPRYAEPALTCLDRFASRQLPDGNWLSNYFGAAACDTMVLPDSSANLADIGTMTLCLAIAAPQCDEPRRTRYLNAARTYADSISLPNQFDTGAFPNGRWGARKYSFPYTVATATQTASLAALYEVTRDPRYRAAAEKGARWLSSTPQENGAVLLYPHDSNATVVKESTDFGEMFYVADALIWARDAALSLKVHGDATDALNRWLLGREGVLSRTVKGYWFQPQDPWGNSKMGGILYVLACQTHFSDDPVLTRWLNRALGWMSDRERSRTIGVMEHPSSQVGAYALAATGFAGLGIAAALNTPVLFPAHK